MNRDEGGFYFHQNKMINSWAFSKPFLIQDSRTGFKTIILRKKLSYEKNINKDKYILQKIHGIGNFPPLYEALYDDYYCYFVEDLIGFDLKNLFKSCRNKLDLLSAVNIGIDLIINLQLFHNNWYVHRVIKPDNLT